MDQEKRHWQDGSLNVVINDSGAYSIWPENREIPRGWRATGATGSKAECLEFIREHWSDLKPAGLQELEANLDLSDSPGVSPPMEALQQIRSEETPVAFRESMARGYVHLIFSGLPNTPCIGLRLLNVESTMEVAVFTAEFLLDGRRFVCRAELNPDSMSGKAVLKPAT